MGSYEGNRPQDAYVFVSSGSRAAIDALRDLWAKGAVRYVARPLSGAYGAIVFLDAPVPQDDDDPLDVLRILRDRIAAVRDAANPGASVGVALTTGPRAPTRWSEKRPVGAYVRIRAEAGRAREVFDAVNELPAETYAGSALVIGDWDVLLEIGAGTLEELKDALLGRVTTIPGIAWSDTAIVINDTVKRVSPSAW